MAGGRPLKFQSVEELQKRIDEYFKYCDENHEPYIVTGLAVWLKTDRQTLINYTNKEEYFDTIKEAKQKIQAYAEKCLYDVNRKNNAGIIFSLKNNYNWIDQQDINAKINGNMTYAIKLPEELEEEE